MRKTMWLKALVEGLVLGAICTGTLIAIRPNPETFLTEISPLTNTTTTIQMARTEEIIIYGNDGALYVDPKFTVYRDKTKFLARKTQLKIPH